MAKENLELITQKFTDLVKDSFKENLCSIVLYGSAASGNYLAGVSDINILIILYESNPAQIFQFGGSAKTQIIKGRITPQILTKEEFLGSSDIFPLEYIDLKTTRKILFGEDVVENLKIASSNLRHQTESMLRGSIATLRQVLVASGGREKTLLQNLKTLGFGQRALFKGLLRLKGIDTAGLSDQKMLDKITAEYSVNAEAFSVFLELRQGKTSDPLKTTQELILTLVKLASAVDTMEVSDEIK